VFHHVRGERALLLLLLLVLLLLLLVLLLLLLLLLGWATAAPATTALPELTLPSLPGTRRGSRW